MAKVRKRREIKHHRAKPKHPKPMRSVRTYQNHIRQLKDLIRQMQWVSHLNGHHICAACGMVRGHGCFPTCEAAAITGDYGGGRDVSES